METLRHTGNVKESCEKSGIARKTSYEHRHKDPAFAKEWDDAIEDACDELETVARERAKKTSDTLLIFLLKAYRPEMYRDRSQIEFKVRNELDAALNALQRGLGEDEYHNVLSILGGDGAEASSEAGE